MVDVNRGGVEKGLLGSAVWCFAKSAKRGKVSCERRTKSLPTFHDQLEELKRRVPPAKN
jgi:hypothetical protein